MLALALVAPAAAEAGTGCPKVQMIHAVGSGNRDKAFDNVSNEITESLRDEILRPERPAGGGELFVATPLDYPAESVKSGTGIGAVLGLPGPYNNSVNKGKRTLNGLVTDVIRRCGYRTRLILSGHSQGAQVVADIYQEMERDGTSGYVFGVVLFGDPYFNGRAGGRGSSTGQWRHVDYRRGSLGRRQVYGRYDRGRYLLRIRSYCHKFDPVCQDGTRPNLAHHSNYDKTGPNEPGEAQDAGRWLSTKLRTAFAQDAAAAKPVHAPPPGCVPASSVATIIDDSGSMARNDPQRIRAQAMQLLLSKPASASRAVGAVEFGESAATLFAPGLVSAGLTNMIGSLGRLQNDGSDGTDDGATSYNAGFAKSVADQPAPGARIFLTDGGHNVGAYVNGHAGGARTYVIGANIGPAGQGDEDGDRLGRIAAETGGAYFPLRKLPGDDVGTQTARLQPVVNEIDALLSCSVIHDQASVGFTRAGQFGRGVRTDFGGQPALEAVVSWAVPGVDIDLVAATVRDRRNRVIADLAGRKRIARTKQRRTKLRVGIVEGQTFDTITVTRPRNGRTLTLQFRAATLASPTTAEVQIRPVLGGGTLASTLLPTVPTAPAAPPPATPAAPVAPPPVTPPPVLPPPPKPTATNLRVVVYGGGHVGVAFDVGWQQGRDPVTCHFFRDNVEVFTAQCGTSSSKQFFGVPAGTHSWYATVSDRFGVYSNPTNTVTVYSG